LAFVYSTSGLLHLIKLVPNNTNLEKQEGQKGKGSNITEAATTKLKLFKTILAYCFEAFWYCSDTSYIFCCWFTNVNAYNKRSTLSIFLASKYSFYVPYVCISMFIFHIMEMWRKFHSNHISMTISVIFLAI
jgi:hypothetical protein